MTRLDEIRERWSYKLDAVLDETALRAAFLRAVEDIAWLVAQLKEARAVLALEQEAHAVTCEELNEARAVPPRGQHASDCRLARVLAPEK